MASRSKMQSSFEDKLKYKLVSLLNTELLKVINGNSSTSDRGFFGNRSNVNLQGMAKFMIHEAAKFIKNTLQGERDLTLVDFTNLLIFIEEFVLKNVMCHEINKMVDVYNEFWQKVSDNRVCKCKKTVKPNLSQDKIKKPSSIIIENKEMFQFCSDCIISTQLPDVIKFCWLSENNSKPCEPTQSSKECPESSEIPGFIKCCLNCGKSWSLPEPSTKTTTPPVIDDKKPEPEFSVEKEFNDMVYQICQGIKQLDEIDAYLAGNLRGRIIEHCF